MGMKLDRIKPLFDDPGPFASAYAEVSRAQEDGDTLAELAALTQAGEVADGPDRSSGSVVVAA